MHTPDGLEIPESSLNVMMPIMTRNHTEPDDEDDI